MKNRKSGRQVDGNRHPLGEEVYTIDEAAHALRLSPKYLYRQIQGGKLRARRTGKQFLLTQGDIRAFWESLPKTTDDDSANL